jgi:superfamily II DNA or RNA helicase
MSAKLEQLTPGTNVRGILPAGALAVIQGVTWFGPDTLEAIYKDAAGRISSEIIGRDRESSMEVTQQGRAWSFDGDGAKFRLVSEAHRIGLAHQFDPVLAVHTSTVQPLPHQITAVYESMLPRQPLRFLLADDPGAGKTIMAGLLIKELIARGDLHRCLVVTPGSLSEQWQDELTKKFNLNFEICTNDKLEAAGTNWFLQNNLVIARLDKLARDEVTQAKLLHADCQWDLIIFDEAHKLSASYAGNEVKYTQRYQLARNLGPTTRHLLLMTATPHNGKDEDFDLFMALLDSDRFEGKHRDGVHTVACDDMMRRMVKENLLKFDGTPLFPERRAHAVPYELTEEENLLYSAVSAYVRDEFNRADKIEDGKRKVSVGFALTLLQRRLASSPQAIYRSLQRRHDRLDTQLQELKMGQTQVVVVGKGGLVDVSDVEDYEDDPTDEGDVTAGEVVDQATAAKTIVELEQEIITLAKLVDLARKVVASGVDRKWKELSGLLAEIYPAKPAEGEGQYEVPAGPAAGQPQRKLVIFTEHRDTLDYLQARLTKYFGREEPVVHIHGGMGREERLTVQERFKGLPEVLVLLATDAAGEGINLQRAHLMVNYDLPWNPNRLEQRFGRIHRIGQTEVCHLWNLIAINTREGDVYKQLLEKLEQARKALGGQVFDVLGKLQFEGSPLRDLLIEAIRYGNDPEVRARLHQKVDGGVNHQQLTELVEEGALNKTVLDSARIAQLRVEMERAEAARLQPHYVEAFFREAFQQLGGNMRPAAGEERRYQIDRVPGVITARDRQIGLVAPVLPRYERVTFEKDKLSPAGQIPATFLCPGHPLLDCTIDLTIERNRDLLRQGAVLVDERDDGTTPRVLVYLEHVVEDGVMKKVGDQEVPRTVSRQLLYVEMKPNGDKQAYQYAPYLDYRPLKAGSEPSVEEIMGRPELSWAAGDLEREAVIYAIQHAVPKHFDKVKADKLALIDKTSEAVKQRLSAAINYWDHRAQQLREQERTGGGNNRLNSAQASRRAEDLDARLHKRLDYLKLERHLKSKAPSVVGACLVLPAGLLAKIQGESAPAPTEPVDTQVSAAKARLIVMELEKSWGHSPVDRELEKLGYDIESVDTKHSKVRFIEVKGRQADADTITVTQNEVRYSLNKPEDFILALVRFANDGTHQVYYITNPFDKEPGFGVSSINFEIKKLLSLPGAKRIV